MNQQLRKTNRLEKWFNIHDYIYASRLAHGHQKCGSCSVQFYEINITYGIYEAMLTLYVSEILIKRMYETFWITHGFWETTRFLIVTIYESLDKRFSMRIVCPRIDTRLVCSRIETRLVCSRIETRLVCRNETRLSKWDSFVETRLDSKNSYTE